MKSKKECDFVLKNLCKYIDKDVDNECCEKIKKHLESCKICSKEYEDFEKVINLCKNSFEKIERKEKEKIFGNIKKLLEKE